MIAATLKALTWGTVATAVASALLLAATDDSLLHATRERSDSARGTTAPPTPRPTPARSPAPTSSAHPELADRSR